MFSFFEILSHLYVSISNCGSYSVAGTNSFARSVCLQDLFVSAPRPFYLHCMGAGRRVQNEISFLEFESRSLG